MEREEGEGGRKKMRENGDLKSVKMGGKGRKKVKGALFQGLRFTKRLFMTCRLGQHFKAGMMAGVLTTVIMAPGERIKCLMQVRVRE